MENSSLNRELTRESWPVLPGKKKVKVRQLVSCCQFSRKPWTQKTFNRKWGQTLTYQSPSYTLFFSWKRKSIDFFCITVDIFLLIPFQKHMMEQLSCFFPTYHGSALSTSTRHQLTARGWNLPALSIQDHTPTASPSVLPEKTSSTGCVILGKGHSGFLGREEWMEVVCQQWSWKWSPENRNCSPKEVFHTRGTSHKRGKHPKKWGATAGLFPWKFWQMEMEDDPAEAAEQIEIIYCHGLPTIETRNKEEKPIGKHKFILIIKKKKKKGNPGLISCHKNYPRDPQTRMIQKTVCSLI